MDEVKSAVFLATLAHTSRLEANPSTMCTYLTLTCTYSLPIGNAFDRILVAWPILFQTRASSPLRPWWTTGRHWPTYAPAPGLIALAARSKYQACVFPSR